MDKKKKLKHQNIQNFNNYLFTNDESAIKKTTNYMVGNLTHLKNNCDIVLYEYCY